MHSGHLLLAHSALFWSKILSLLIWPSSALSEGFACGAHHVHVAERVECGEDTTRHYKTL